MTRGLLSSILLGIAVLLTAAPPSDAAPVWTSPNRCRVLLTVDPRGVQRTNSPAAVDIQFQDVLSSQGITGTFDPDTIEVVGYDAFGQPCVFDPSRMGYERHLLPWRIQKYFGISKVTLSFVMPDHNCTQYAVYFDTIESGLGNQIPGDGR